MLANFQPLFVLINAAFGILIGALHARVPAFATLSGQPFLWLIGGLFLMEVVAGYILNEHPSKLISMPWRFGALVASFATCYATLSLLA